jgi:hypothetical protein
MIPRVWRGVLVLLAALGGCAPATLSPMVMRMGPGLPDSSVFQAGLRAGPRLSAPLSARTSASFDSSEQIFAGDNSSFSTRQWSVAYDVALTKPLGERLALHVGAQGEFYYPLPLPGYGPYGGLSSWYGTSTFGVAPAIVLRGASDFGIASSRGGPGTLLGAETSVSVYLSPEDRVAVGLVPFCGVHRAFTREAASTLVYFGGALVMQVPLGKTDRIEASGGFGHVMERKGESWNVPILGARWGR